MTECLGERGTIELFPAISLLVGLLALSWLTGVDEVLYKFIAEHVHVESRVLAEPEYLLAAHLQVLVHLFHLIVCEYFLAFLL